MPVLSPRTTLLLAFAAVYVIWGSTYFAIRVVLETLPALLFAGVRFLIAGGLLLGWGLARGAPSPTRAQWRSAGIVGGLLFLGGNGGVVLATQWVPSGLVALLVATVPLWMVLLDWAFFSRARPGPRVVVGVLAGLGGIGLLYGSEGMGASDPRQILGAGLVLAGSLAWAAGSMLGRDVDKPVSPRMWVGMQMLAGGALLVPVALLRGEAAGLDLGAVSLRSGLAMGYLIVFGALVAFSAYIHLLQNTTPTRVGTYAYVNPVVAMALGFWLADEPLTPRSLMASAVILGAVVLIGTVKAPVNPARG